MGKKIIVWLGVIGGIITIIGSIVGAASFIIWEFSKRPTEAEVKPIHAEHKAYEKQHLEQSFHDQHFERQQQATVDGLNRLLEKERLPKIEKVELPEHNHDDPRLVHTDHDYSDGEDPQ